MLRSLYTCLLIYELVQRNRFIDLYTHVCVVRFYGRNVFDYFRRYTLGCENTKTKQPAATLSRLLRLPFSSRETNRCFMNLQRMSCSVVSWNSALQTDLCRFAAICKPSAIPSSPSTLFLSLSFLPSLFPRFRLVLVSSFCFQEDAAAKFSSRRDEITESNCGARCHGRSRAIPLLNGFPRIANMLRKI